MAWRCGDCIHYKYEEDYCIGKCEITNEEIGCINTINVDCDDNFEVEE